MQLKSLHLKSTACRGILMSWQSVSLLQCLTTLSIRDYHTPGRCLSLIWSLSSLRALTLVTDSTLAGGDQLAGITALTRLRSLELGNISGSTSYEDEEAALLPISTLTGLEHLKVEYMVVQPFSSLLHLTSLEAELWFDKCMEQVASLTSLKHIAHLEMPWILLMAMGLQHLTGLTALRVTQGVVDAVMLHSLSVLTGLQSLDLGTQGSSDDLSPLQALTGLTWLGLEGQKRLNANHLRDIVSAIAGLRVLCLSHTDFRGVSLLYDVEAFGHLTELQVVGCNWLCSGTWYMLLGLPSMRVLTVGEGQMEDEVYDTRLMQSQVAIVVIERKVG
jgi:hypothetical protein